MKTMIKKDFDAVKFMRQARNEINNDIVDMDYKQIKEYCRNKRDEEHILEAKVAEKSPEYKT